ncbi:hypothetical protein BD410DRAFT_804048 [Rickenella mellea]|uniref:Lysine-specific metallo-endopeptidase domain-containing protein n=1 Tax=Rickenella mellea TaxID=50990 RepID=A0A4Y7Q1Z3_9AGAM|nr:hypothetical protein BD410DRAFT_804048 [Rickenella mellea]
MHSKITLSYVLCLICVIHTPQNLAHPLSRRQGTLTLQVLNNSVDTKLGCTAGEIATLQSALADAKSIVATAAQTLSGVALGGTSPEAVTTFLGISGAELADGITLRFTDVGNFFGGALTQITDLVAGNSATTLRFYCPAASTSAQDGNPCKIAFDAATENLSDGSINKIALCNGFFAGIILIHEAQHSTPLLGGSDSDILEDTATSVADCAALPASEKSGNAENWALTAFLAKVDPSRFA